MPTDRTPQQWAEFCAREVMGWDRLTHVHDWRSPDKYGERIRLHRWSPYENSADALEVLKRLSGRHESYSFGMVWFQRSREWKVFISNTEDHFEANAPGDHYGPAVCELATKILEAE